MSKAQHARLLDAVTKHSGAHGEVLVQRLETAAGTLLAWLKYLRGTAHGAAPELLSGTHAALIETAGSLSLGLVRPSLFSIRAQVDMLLSWLYFKDHPVEWSVVVRTGDGYQLREAIFRYLRQCCPRFKERLELLEKRRNRSELDPYRVLSAHVHSQSPATLPAVGGLDSLVQNRTRCDEAVTLQGEVAEYLGDVLVSVYAPTWHDLPTSITKVIASRLSKPELKDICKA